jgi:hypothetical protein
MGCDPNEGCWWPEEQSVVVACEVALDAPHRLDAALAFGFLAREVGTRGRVDAPAGDRDDMKRPG